jgi:hypothetical protein
MKTILATLKLKWAEYLIEIMVITIGILGAFTLNNWNTNRMEGLQGQEIIRNIHEDLNNTIKEFEKLNEIRGYVIESTSLLLALSPTETLDNERLDSLLSLTFYRPTFNNKLGSINLLFTSGKINLIKNDSIRDLLIGLPGEIDDLIEEEEYSNQAFHDQYLPVVFKYIVFENIPLQVYGSTLIGTADRRQFHPTAINESNYRGLLQDQAFRNHISFRRMQMDLTINEALYVIKRLHLIIDLIDQELSA